MKILIAISSYLFFTFIILPYLDSFAYIKKNVILHALLGFLIPIIHKLFNLTFMENLFFISFLFFSRKNALDSKNMIKQNPDMIDFFGHKTVEKANIVLFICFTISLLVINGK